MVQVLKNELREAILKAACEEFHEHGYAAASVKKMADKVGISAGNVYRYFPSKEALFDSVVEPVYRELEFMINGHSGRSQLENEAAVIDAIVKVLTGIAQKYRIMLLILIDGSKGTRHEDAVLKLHHMMADHIVSHVAAYNKKQPQKALDEGVAMPVAAAFMQGYFETIRRYPDPAACKNMIRQYLLFWYQGLQTFL